MAQNGKEWTGAQVTGPTVIRTKRGLNPMQKCFDRPHCGTEHWLDSSMKKAAQDQ